jgi:hypothetical protein
MSFEGTIINKFPNYDSNTFLKVNKSTPKTLPDPAGAIKVKFSADDFELSKELCK